MAGEANTGALRSLRASTFSLSLVASSTDDGAALRDDIHATVRRHRGGIVVARGIETLGLINGAAAFRVVGTGETAALHGEDATVRHDRAEDTYGRCLFWLPDDVRVRDVAAAAGT
jgi:hypothetical protein